jgi:hypothetical protein
MSELFDINHADGDLDDYDSTIVDGGDLSVSAGAALAGTDYGLALLIDDTNDLRVTKNISLSTTDIRLRFYIDPNGLSMSTGALAEIQAVKVNTTPGSICLVSLYYDGSDYQIKATAIEDNGTEIDSSYYTITDSAHYIEIHLDRSGSAGMSNGTLDLWIDGVHKEQITGVDNFHIWAYINGCTLEFEHVSGTISGTFYLDAYAANDDGSEIGAVESSGSSSIVIFRRRIEGVV